jgi:hypothetical protein
MSNYSIQEHSHNFACWAASRAASTSLLFRFKVRDGKNYIESAGFTKDFEIDNLPTPDSFDSEHKKWREAIIRQRPGWSHGVAAKLINVYLKTRFVSEFSAYDNKVAAIHPPIDSILLKGIIQKLDEKNKEKDEIIQGQINYLKKVKWSKMSFEQYEKVIDIIRQTLGPGEPLWSIEEYWRGYQ